METTYKLLADTNYVLIIRDGIISFIPPDERNSDWQQYQAWLALGNEPEPAE